MPAVGGTVKRQGLQPAADLAAVELFPLLRRQGPKSTGALFDDPRVQLPPEAGREGSRPRRVREHVDVSDGTFFDVSVGDLEIGVGLRRKADE